MLAIVAYCVCSRTANVRGTDVAARRDTRFRQCEWMQEAVEASVTSEVTVADES